MINYNMEENRKLLPTTDISFSTSYFGGILNWRKLKLISRVVMYIQPLNSTVSPLARNKNMLQKNLLLIRIVG